MGLADLEQRLDRHLSQPRVTKEAARGLPETAAAWSAEIWRQADPAATTARMATFLGIEWAPSLLSPTAAGIPTANNSSFTADQSPGRIHTDIHQQWMAVLTHSERMRITVAAQKAVALGYDVPRLPAWRRAWSQLVLRLRPSV